MKTMNRIFFAALAAMFGFASCSQELTPVERPSDSFVTVRFGAESGIVSTKATLNSDDEKTFTSAWEEGDAISVAYTSPAGQKGVVAAVRKGDAFEAELPKENGKWTYKACYPVPAGSLVDFAASRTQKADSYNSAYDIMTCSEFVVDNADEGKTADGKNIVFKMERQTAIAYFHISGGPADESVVSARLSVEGGAVAASSANMSDFAFTPTGDLKEITIAFPESSPKASDFKLWFNLLPTEYSKVTLTVETPKKRFVLKCATPGKYEATNLYKVVKSTESTQWIAKLPAEFAVKLPEDNGDIKLDYKPQTLAFEWEAVESLSYKTVFSLSEDLSSPVDLDLNSTGKDVLTHEQLDGVMAGLGVKDYHSAKIYWALRASNSSGSRLSAVRSMQIQRIMAFTDPRDGEVYRVARIVNSAGEETIWMADNLRATKYSDGTPLAEGHYRFSLPAADADDYHKEWCRLRGAYYSWTAAVRETEKAAVGETVQGIAPDGWHIPTQADWVFLINNQPNNSQPAKSMRTKDYWAADMKPECDNACGLNIVASGYIWTITEASHPINIEETQAFFWASSLADNGDAYTYAFSTNDNGIACWPYAKDRGYSLRCVLNK